MDLTGRGAAPRVLVAAARGGRDVRLEVERAAREWGWELALSPADADLLVVCGSPDAATATAVERVWGQLPSPRARADVGTVGDVADQLRRACTWWSDRDRQRADARERDSGPARSEPGGGGEHDDHGGDGEHDHHAHGGAVAGLPMAERAPDRDGLTLDRVHVALGPVLPDWPAGLVVRLALQGDVVQSAEVEVVGAPGPPSTRPVEADALDSLSRLLSVCGVGTAARSARRWRDDVLAGHADPAALRRFTRRLRRSWTLRWATDGVGRLDGRSDDLAGDATCRWHRWLDVVDGAAPEERPDRAAAVLAELPGLLEGREMATARVVVASLDPDLDRVVVGVPT